MKNRANEISLDVNSSAEIKTISTETVTIAAGIAGTVKECQFNNFPIRNSKGGDLGGLGDSSIALTSSTFDNEVAYGTKDADLANGDYWVDYLNGVLRGKKKDAGVSMTANYKIAVLNISVDEIEVTANNNIVQLNGNTIGLGAGTVGTGTQRVTLASDDPAVVKLGTIDGKITACNTGAVVVASGAITESNSGAIKTALEIMDDWDQSDRAKVNVNLNSGVAVDIGAGNASTGTARVAIATDDVNTAAIKAAVEIMDDWDDGADSAKVVGNVAHDAVDAGSPLKVGGKASTAKPSAVANADRVNAYFDEYGRMHVVDEGGSSVLPVTHRNPQDFTVAYTSNVTITATGAPFTVSSANCRIAYIYYKPTAGTWQSPLVQGVNGVSITSSGNVITVAGAGTPFASGDEYLVGIIHQDKGHDTSTNASQVFEISPIYNRHLEETFVPVTTVDGTYYYYVDMDGYSGLNLQLILSGGSGTCTVTVEATIQDDGTAAASCTYHDVSTAVFGSASWTATTMLLDDSKSLGGVKYARVKVVASTGGANDASWTIHGKKLY